LNKTGTSDIRTSIKIMRAIKGQYTQRALELDGEKVEKKDQQQEVYFEFISVGQQVRVSAIDPETGVEAVIIAPASASQLNMQRIATAKLMRKLERDQNQ